MEYTQAHGTFPSGWFRRFLVFAVLCVCVAAAGSAQTLGLASLAWLPSDASRQDEKLAGRMMEELECGILDFFFQNGCIGFNIPNRMIREGTQSALVDNLEFINLGNAMEQGGAQAGILAELWLGFSRNPDRVFVREMRLSSLRLHGPGQDAGDAIINPLAKSIKLSGAADTDIKVMLARISQAFPKVLELN